MENRPSIASATVTGVGSQLAPFVIDKVTYDLPTEDEQRALQLRLEAVRDQLTVLPPHDLADLMPGDVLLPTIVIPEHLSPEPHHVREIRQVVGLIPAEEPTLPMRVSVVTEDGIERFLAWSHHTGVVRMPGMPFSDIFAMVSRIWHETAPDVDRPVPHTLVLHDIVNGAVTEFMRTHHRDDTGRLTGYTDRTLDGDPYTPVGEIACPPKAERP